MAAQFEKDNAQRRQAEQKASRMPTHPPDKLGKMSLEETRQMIYELQVHQIELEMQNEELHIV